MPHTTLNQSPSTPYPNTIGWIALLLSLLTIPQITLGQRLKESDLGTTLWLELDTAPFPHESRAEGYTRRDTTYPFEEHYNDKTVLVFTPKGYKPLNSIDFLIYFHGHRNHVRQAVDVFRLREQLVASGRQLVLVFPQGPYNASDSSCGKMADQDGLKLLLKDICGHYPVPFGSDDPAIGRVVLSGHSGAYLGIGQCLKVGGLRDHIDEVHLLDASYGQWDAYVGWMAEDPASHRFFSIFTDHLAAANVGMITELQARGLTATLVGDRFETLGGGPWPQRVFVHSRLSDHNQAVAWLERSLRARKPVAAED
ncbi:hypothetical protein [Mucisphaera calidilacus]|uniref:Uncharacterized protein n=1 Tax=Mucisphaera calidilacus TaxID=2527982 RepID=A0A518BYB2_9BACT|nr:hypothetical protein [Mucisphaera calidilacus]QDU71948.1 hypothetical protein Pan265_18070 [Mucisphaera calidilacus]